MSIKKGKGLAQWKAWIREELDKALVAFEIPPESVRLEFVPSLPAQFGAARADSLRNKVEVALDGFASLESALQSKESSAGDQKVEEDEPEFSTDLEPLRKFVMFHEVGHLKDRLAQKVLGIAACCTAVGVAASWAICKKVLPWVLPLSTTSGDGGWGMSTGDWIHTLAPVICLLVFGQLGLYVLQKHSERAEMRADELAADRLLALGEARPVAVSLCTRLLVDPKTKGAGGHASPHVEVAHLREYLIRKGHTVEIERQDSEGDASVEVTVNGSSVKVSWKKND